MDIEHTFQETPRVKICCISNWQEARLAMRYGAAPLGLVSAMPSGPGVISEEDIAAIARRVPPGLSTFLLTSLQSVEAIAAQQKRCGTDTVQICDRLLTGTHAELRRAIPGIRLVQVIHVVDEHSVEEALSVAPEVHALILDSGRPSQDVKELGGTGRTHDWSLSQRIIANSLTPVFLAGGLKPDNVGAAVRTLRPYGLDLCSGVRSEGHLDEEKLAAFFRQVRGAAREE